MRKSYLKGVEFHKAPKIDFLKRLTNQTGVVQHTSYGVPERSLGYSLDDNARALIAVVNFFRLFKKKAVLDLAVIYLSFLLHAKTKNGFFYNFQSFDHKFVNKTSEDAFGEVIWALGMVMSGPTRTDVDRAAKNLFSQIEDNIDKLKALRAKAYAILGLVEISTMQPKNEKLIERINGLAESLVRAYQKNKEANWYWFEDKLSYANHILPAALFKAGAFLKNSQMLRIAEESLDFVKEKTHEAGIPVPIGNKGWLPKGKEKAFYDQQPIDPSYAVIANVEAFKVTKNPNYLTTAREWFAWFHGFNLKGLKIYDNGTQGCYDGLMESGVNQNQGAESIICYLIAYLEISLVESELLVSAK